MIAWQALSSKCKYGALAKQIYSTLSENYHARRITLEPWKQSIVRFSKTMLFLYNFKVSAFNRSVQQEEHLSNLPGLASCQSLVCMPVPPGVKSNKKFIPLIKHEHQHLQGKALSELYFERGFVSQVKLCITSTILYHKCNFVLPIKVCTGKICIASDILYYKRNFVC